MLNWRRSGVRIGAGGMDGNGAAAAAKGSADVTLNTLTGSTGWMGGGGGGGGSNDLAAKLRSHAIGEQCRPPSITTGVVTGQPPD